MNNINNMNNMNNNINFNNKLLLIEENQKEINTFLLSLQNEITTLKAQITNMHETFNNTLSLILKNNNTNTTIKPLSSSDSSSSDSDDYKKNVINVRKIKNINPRHQKRNNINNRRLI